MRTRLGQNLAPLGLIKDAQRHHYLHIKPRLIHNLLTKDLLRKLIYMGLILHYEPRAVRGQLLGGAVRKPFTVTLRYWEGQPLVTVQATPGLVCTYDSLKRRLRQGGGSMLLLWQDGAFVTGAQCLPKRQGARLCAVVS